MKLRFLYLLSFLFIPYMCQAKKKASIPLYFCTAADTQFYEQLLVQIGSIHRYDYENVQEIAVFDLGFTPQERQFLNNISKVTVYDVEMTHPDLLTPFHVRSSTSKEKDRKARGWYAWKPVVIKQALDMFPHLLYMDSGIHLLRSAEPIFEHIQNQGYYLITCGHSIKWMMTEYIVEKFNLRSPDKSFILDEKTYGLSAGLQGHTHATYESYILPMYELAKDIRNFEDDGTTPEGFGTARHDQPLFSMFARLLDLTILTNQNKLNVQKKYEPGPFFKFKGPQLDRSMKKYIIYK